MGKPPAKMRHKPRPQGAADPTINEIMDLYRQMIVALEANTEATNKLSERLDGLELADS